MLLLNEENRSSLNNKALLGVSVEGDGMYFEATYNGEAKEMYLDVYKKQAHKTIK